MKKDNNGLDTVYIYVHSFKWKSTEDTTHFKGHLKEGRVYHTSVEEVDGDMIYKIDLFEDEESPAGIALRNLKNESDICVYEAVELTDELILDLNITEDDMAMIALESSQYIAKNELNSKESTKEVKSGDVRTTINEMLDKLDGIDPDMVKYFLLMIGTVTETLADEEYITLTGHLSTMEDVAGKTANITMAATALESHLNSEDNAPHSLLNAVYAIMLELKRTVQVK